MPQVMLKPGHVQPVWSGHPWVYAQAIQRVEGGAGAGDEVSVVDPRGNLLGRGFYSPRSAIPVRIAVKAPGPLLGPEWLHDRLTRAVALRQDLGLPDATTNAYRIANAEGDGLPGLVVDIFDDVAAVQFGTIGMKLRQAAVFEAIREVLKVRAIVDRTPQAFAKLEGFEASSGIVWGDESVDAYRFMERGIRFEIPFELGQKTGFYVDQRLLRARVEELARGRRVLDVYSFVGTFAMACVRGGATSVLAVDENALAMEIGARCAKANGLDHALAFERSAARKALDLAGQDGGYDLVILDPPAMAPSQRASTRALGAYQKLASMGCRATRPGGLMVLCSCSAAVGTGELTRALALGARDVGMSATVLERMFQGPDHPVPAAFAEGLYLKSLIARIELR